MSSGEKMNKHIIAIGLMALLMLEVHLTTSTLASNQDEAIAHYDPARFSTYWGGSTNDVISSVIHGKNAEIIIAGYTESDALKKGAINRKSC